MVVFTLHIFFVYHLGSLLINKEIDPCVPIPPTEDPSLEKYFVSAALYPGNAGEQRSLGLGQGKRALAQLSAVTSAGAL